MHLRANRISYDLFAFSVRMQEARRTYEQANGSDQKPILGKGRLLKEKREQETKPCYKIEH